MSNELCFCLASGRTTLSPPSSGGSRTRSSAAPRALDPVPGKEGTWDWEWGKGEDPGA